MNLVFMGPPGAGKGTQAARIIQKLGIPQISTGDILRKAIREESEIGKQAKSYVERGLLVPDEVVIAIVRERISEPDCANGYLLDGFPRTVEQAEQLATFATIDAAVNLDVAREHLLHRLGGRFFCPKCNATPHISNLGDSRVCPRCGAPLIQRDDDKPEAIERRLVVYENQTKPLIEYYENNGLLRNVDGAMDVDAVTAEICRVLGIKE